MKRKSPAKLTLHRETIRPLDGAGLRAAGGETEAVACYTQAPSCRKPCSAQFTCAPTCPTTTHTTTTTNETA
jgi:hypothetical protein